MMLLVLERTQAWSQTIAISEQNWYLCSNCYFLKSYSQSEIKRKICNFMSQSISSYIWYLQIYFYNTKLIYSWIRFTYLKNVNFHFSSLHVKLHRHFGPWRGSLSFLSIGRRTHMYGSRICAQFSCANVPISAPFELPDPTSTKSRITISFELSFLPWKSFKSVDQGYFGTLNLAPESRQNFWSEVFDSHW